MFSINYIVVSLIIFEHRINFMDAYAEWNFKHLIIHMLFANKNALNVT